MKKKEMKLVLRVMMTREQNVRSMLKSIKLMSRAIVKKMTEPTSTATQSTTQEGAAKPEVEIEPFDPAKVEEALDKLDILSYAQRGPTIERGGEYIPE